MAKKVKVKPITDLLHKDSLSVKEREKLSKLMSDAVTVRTSLGESNDEALSYLAKVFAKSCKDDQATLQRMIANLWDVEFDISGYKDNLPDYESKVASEVSDHYRSDSARSVLITRLNDYFEEYSKRKEAITTESTKELSITQERPQEMPDVLREMEAQRELLEAKKGKEKAVSKAKVAGTGSEEDFSAWKDETKKILEGFAREITESDEDYDEALLYNWFDKLLNTAQERGLLDEGRERVFETMGEAIKSRCESKPKRQAERTANAKERFSSFFESWGNNTISDPNGYNSSPFEAAEGTRKGFISRGAEIISSSAFGESIPLSFPEEVKSEGGSNTVAMQDPDSDGDTQPLSLDEWINSQAVTKLVSFLESKILLSEGTISKRADGIMDVLIHQAGRHHIEAKEDVILAVYNKMRGHGEDDDQRRIDTFFRKYMDDHDLTLAENEWIAPEEVFTSERVVEGIEAIILDLKPRSDINFYSSDDKSQDSTDKIKMIKKFAQLHSMNSALVPDLQLDIMQHLTDKYEVKSQASGDDITSKIHTLLTEVRNYLEEKPENEDLSRAVLESAKESLETFQRALISEQDLTPTKEKSEYKEQMTVLKNDIENIKRKYPVHSSERKSLQKMLDVLNYEKHDLPLSEKARFHMAKDLFTSKEDIFKTKSNFSDYKHLRKLLMKIEKFFDKRSKEKSIDSFSRVTSARLDKLEKLSDQISENLTKRREGFAEDKARHSKRTSSEVVDKAPTPKSTN